MLPSGVFWKRRARSSASECLLAEAINGVLDDRRGY
jgi:hypothetical protein